MSSSAATARSPRCNLPGSCFARREARRTFAGFAPGAPTDGYPGSQGIHRQFPPTQATRSFAILPGSFISLKLAPCAESRADGARFIFWPIAGSREAAFRREILHRFVVGILHSMVNRNLIRGLDLNEQEWEQELTAALEGADHNVIEWSGDDITINEIVVGCVLC